MRLRRTVLWSTTILLAAVLACCLAVALLLPRGWLDARLKESLNDRLHPLRVDFSGMGPLLRDGPGVSIEGLRLFMAEPGEQTVRDSFLSVDRLTVRLSVEDLLRRRVGARLVLESPALRTEPQGREAPSFEAIAGTLSQCLRLRAARNGGTAGDSRRLGSLSSLFPLPAGLMLTGMDLEIRNGSVHSVPSATMTGVRSSLRVESDLSFTLELARGELHWSGGDKGLLRVSATVGAEIRGRGFSMTDSQLGGTLRLEQTALEWEGRAAALTEPVRLSFGCEAEPDGILSVPQLSLAGPGLEVGMAGSMRLVEGRRQVEIRDLNASVEDWRILSGLLSPGTAFSGKLSLLADRVHIEPGRVALHRAEKGSFLFPRLEGLSCEGLRLHVTEGRLARATPGGVTVNLHGFTARVEQHRTGWNGTIELADLEALRGKDLRLTGPVSARAEWLDQEDASKAAVTVDLTRGSLVYADLLAKPPDVPLKMRVRARILPGEIRPGRASLQLGDTRWVLQGSIKDFADPVLNASLHPNSVSLEALAALSPKLREEGVSGRIEIREFALGARPGAFRKSARLRARMAGKDLTVRGTSIKGLYAQARYTDQELTIDPVMIQPTTGMISASFSADFSQAARQGKAEQPYCGTFQVDHVELDDLLRPVCRNLEGRVLGSADVNLAFRGSGFARPGAAAGLEARARIYLNHVTFEKGDDPDRQAAAGIAGKLEGILQGLDTGETVPRQDDLFPPEQDRRLTANRAAGWFDMQAGCIRTDNLVVIYEGRLIEVRGSVDLEGRLHVEKGLLFAAGRKIPFRLDCGLAQAPCLADPDSQDEGDDAATALSNSLRLLSDAAQGVYGDLRLGCTDTPRESGPAENPATP